MNSTNDIAVRLKLLKLLKENPKLTQRQMNKQMGISLGKINFCLSELAKEGLIKVERFKKTEKKISYIYYLTPKGIEEILKLTIRFLKKRINEYNEIKKEIKTLSEDVRRIDSELFNDPELQERLREMQG